MWRTAFALAFALAFVFSYGLLFLITEEKLESVVAQRRTDVFPGYFNDPKTVAVKDNGDEKSLLVQQPHIYLCSHYWMFSPIAISLFPEFPKPIMLHDANPADYTENDIVITHPGLECDNTGLPGYPKHPGLRLGREQGPWKFPGKILYVNGEWHMDPRGERDYHVGYIPDSDRSVQVFWIVILLLFGQLKQSNGQIFDHDRKPPPNNGKHFLLYVASHCVDYREDAFDALANIDEVHYGGACRGAAYGRNSDWEHPNIKPAPAKSNFDKSQLAKNSDFYHDYRFALVMENKNHDGYVSEKIVNAFLGGVVPIYYGTPDIFKLFNRKAFIYYDIEKPQEAWKQIQYLENNKTAYEEMLAEPILANGMETMSEYFSLEDDFGHGKLKNKIRSMMGL
mmetsp:Transcript_9217/g.13424  ORF Transcript_9217/g.13424 Transcript_9217/m.13424 type:complete len:395 (+) Transcript_9217:85-1269(+)|eukprot:CAMPEP_0195519052 /NCGR_PEP_ID=MMETSP0794_2-20130614/14283_1 /TAXON_ID=515487 /ORGANISM="Stephanopyxis turris, Strain CCMP 815" /LENGTH=394 /DNA_ID=CAMNT_0040648143 /DNA_START=81 /DNA_END=1265 /DNA_ORIENTATION=+